MAAASSTPNRCGRRAVAVFSRTRLCAALLLAGIGLPATALADATVLANAPGTTGNSTGGMSDDGTSIVGTGVVGGNVRGILWVNGTGSILSPLLGDSRSDANGISGNGLVVVGDSVNAFNRAVSWTSGGAALLLAALPGSTGESTAFGASTNGGVIVGRAKDAGGLNNAVVWTSNGTVIAALTPLTAATAAQANGVSGDGTLAVGSSQNAGGQTHAVMWTVGSAAAPTDLGVLSVGGISSAAAISRDGSTVTGTATTGGQTHVFRYTGGVMTDLGNGGNGNVTTTVRAINANGTVIVGFIDAAFGGFRWSQSAGFQSVKAWLDANGVNTTGSSFTTATGVNAAGTTVVGAGNIGGVGQNYIASAGGATSGVVGLTDLSNSLSGMRAPSALLDGLISLTYNGAHHRTLMDLPMPVQNGRRNCVWASGDLGGYNHRDNSWVGLAETGVCRDFAGSSLRAGVGLGHSETRMGQDNGGSSRLRGEYLMAELDWAIPGSGLLASFTGISGHWNANLRRGYALAATSPSNGSTSADALSVRARLDWRNAFSLGQVRFTPSVAYTVTRSRIGAYQEVDGTAPAYFNGQSHTSQEARSILTGAYTVSSATEVRGRLEWVHRFDSQGANVSGSVNALGVTLPFSMPGNATPRNWGRVGADLDHKLDARNMLSISGTLASSGTDASWSVAASYRHFF